MINVSLKIIKDFVYNIYKKKIMNYNNNNCILQIYIYI
jgi:hypothetical protein